MTNRSHPLKTMDKGSLKHSKITMGSRYPNWVPIKPLVIGCKHHVINYWSISWLPMLRHLNYLAETPTWGLCSTMSWTKYSFDGG
ncbi:hypothetical protein VIGAN_02209600, partial [Vigna angularis var. angularis]